MLRVNVQVSAAAAKEYYTEALSRQDYYSENQEIIGLWGGKGAEALGLTGKVEQDQFAALCENRMPDSRDNLTPRTKANRRVGYDFNFHVPKSVSVLQQIMGDGRILPEFRQAVAETMAEIERDMQVRVRRGGNGNRATGNMVWAEFIHETSRPVDGIPDCHTHAHCFVFNASFDDVEQRWKAGEFGNISRDLEYYEAAFHSRFAGRMAGLGYEIERKGKFWEVAGVTPEVVEKFSRRGAQVQAEAEKRGITDPKLKDYLGGYTRERKDSAKEGLNCREEWLSRLTASEKSVLAQIHAEALRKGNSGSGEGGSAAAAQGVDYALRHHFQNLSVVEERKLMASALRHAVGKATIPEVQAAFSASAIRRVTDDGRSFVTTDEALKEEAELLEMVRRNTGRERPFLSKHRFKRDFLSKEQKAAALHVLGSRDGLIAIRGGAGTGKTTLIQEVVDAIGESGRKVHIFAPTAKARDVLREDGFAAHTLARLLADPEQQAKLKGGVLWLDEAGLVSVPDMLAVLKLAEKQGARVVLSGDERQHQSVVRGDALRIMRKLGGLKSAELVEIQRQKGDYKRAIQAISEGRMGEGLEVLEEMGSIREMDSEKASREIASRYVRAMKRKKTALIVSPTHREGDRVSQAVRDELKKEGMIGKREWELIRQVNLNWTAAQKEDSNHYAPGMVIQFSQNAKGFTKGDRMVVASVEPGRLGCARAGGGPATWFIDLPAVKGDRFQVYRSETIKIARGERLRITQGGKGRSGAKLENGAVFTLKTVTADGHLEMTNGIKVPCSYGNLNYGYVATSYAAQGRTVDEVFVAQGRESLAASGKEQLYVSASRGRERIEIYTDDKSAMFDAVNIGRQRLSATELTTKASNMQDDTEDGKKVEGVPGKSAEPPKPDAKPGESSRSKIDETVEKMAGPFAPPQQPKAEPPAGFKDVQFKPATNNFLDQVAHQNIGVHPSVVPNQKPANNDPNREKEIIHPSEQEKQRALLDVRQKEDMMHRSNSVAKNAVPTPPDKKGPAPSFEKSDKVPAPATPQKQSSEKTFVERVGGPKNQEGMKWTTRIEPNSKPATPEAPPPAPPPPKNPGTAGPPPAPPKATPSVRPPNLPKPTPPAGPRKR